MKSHHSARPGDPMDDRTTGREGIGSGSRPIECADPPPVRRCDPLFGVLRCCDPGRLYRGVWIRRPGHPRVLSASPPFLTGTALAPTRWPPPPRHPGPCPPPPPGVPQDTIPSHWMADTWRREGGAHTGGDCHAWPSLRGPTRNHHTHRQPSPSVRPPLGTTGAAHHSAPFAPSNRPTAKGGRHRPAEGGVGPATGQPPPTAYGSPHWPPRVLPLAGAHSGPGHPSHCTQTTISKYQNEILSRFELTPISMSFGHAQYCPILFRLFDFLDHYVCKSSSKKTTGSRRNAPSPLKFHQKKNKYILPIFCIGNQSGFNRNDVCFVARVRYLVQLNCHVHFLGALAPDFNVVVAHCISVILKPFTPGSGFIPRCKKKECLAQRSVYCVSCKCSQKK